MLPTVGERPAAPDEACHPGRGERRWRQWMLMSAVAFALAACAVGVFTGASVRPVVSRPAAGQAAAAGYGTSIVRVLSSTGQVRAGPGFPEVNGIADGFGRLWLTGDNASQNHVLYAVDPATSRTDASLDLPSRLVINPNDLAIGSGAIWAAVGASVYRVDPASTPAVGMITRAFAALPQGGLIGDLAADAGAIWVTDTTRGKVYRFAVPTGKLEAVIPVGTTAGAMAVGDGGLWVADGNAHTVSRISVQHNRVDRVLTVPGVPSHIAASDGGLWVTDGTGGGVTVLDRASGRAFTVRVGGEPTGVAASGDSVWVANTADGTLSRIDARRHVVVATVRVGIRPYAVAADRRGVWVALLGRPVMMHTAQGSPAAGLLSWVAQLCG